jgi:hypothetical protein
MILYTLARVGMDRTFRYYLAALDFHLKDVAVNAVLRLFFVAEGPHQSAMR